VRRPPLLEMSHNPIEPENYAPNSLARLPLMFRRQENRQPPFRVSCSTGGRRLPLAMPLRTNPVWRFSSKDESVLVSEEQHTSATNRHSSDLG